MHSHISGFIIEIVTDFLLKELIYKGEKTIMKKLIKILLALVAVSLTLFVSCTPDVEVSVDPAPQEITINFTIINETDKPVDVKLYYFERSDDNHTWCLCRKSANDEYIVTESVNNSIQKNLTITETGYYLSEFDKSFVLIIDGKAYTGFSEKTCTDSNANELNFDIVQQNIGWLVFKDNQKDNDIYYGTIQPEKLTEEWCKWGLYYTATVSETGVDFILDELIY